MKAEIFYYEGQDLEVHRIREALSLQFESPIEIDLKKITGEGGEASDVKTRHFSATRYVQLVLASIVPGTTLHVTGVFAHGFYIYSTYYGRTQLFQSKDLAK